MPKIFLSLPLDVKTPRDSSVLNYRKPAILLTLSEWEAQGTPSTIDHGFCDEALKHPDASTSLMYVNG